MTLDKPTNKPRPQTRALFLTQAEADNPILACAIDGLGWADADRFIIEDLPRPPDCATLPVNRVLWQPYQVYEQAQGYDAVLVTLFRGMAYYLLQTDPDKTQVLPYRSMLADKLLGTVVNEAELVGIELEEHIITQHRDRLLCYAPNILDVIDHKRASSEPQQDFSNAPSPRNALLSAHYINLPHPRRHKPMTPPNRSTRLTVEEYLEWHHSGTLPPALNDMAKPRDLIVVDEGYDTLDLATRLADQGQIARVIRAYDQRKPRISNPATEIPAIRSSAYFTQLHSAACENRYLGFGPVTDHLVPVCAGPPPKVSVIITYHNRPQFFGELLAGFASQTCREFELIVVDNGSNSDFSFNGPYPFAVRYLRNHNSYPGFARNLGASLSTADHLIFFDDDNIPGPNFIAEMLAAAHHGPHDITLCFRDLFLTRQGTAVSRGFQLSAPHLKFSSSFRNYLGDNVFILKRSVFSDLRYTDFFEVGREDIEFLQHARDQGLKVGILPKDLYAYRLSNSDKIGNRHLTHRTEGAATLDYGAYRKYFRSAEGFAERKYRQITDNLMVRPPPRARRPWHRRAMSALRARAARSPALRSLYFSLKTSAAR